MALLSAVKAGIFVVQAAGNTGPSPKSMSSFSPWIFSVGAASHDRIYNNSITLGNNLTIPGVGLACKFVFLLWYIFLVHLERLPFMMSCFMARLSVIGKTIIIWSKLGHVLSNLILASYNTVSLLFFVCNLNDQLTAFFAIKIYELRKTKIYSLSSWKNRINLNFCIISNTTYNEGAQNSLWLYI